MNPELRAFVAEIVRSTLRQESPAMIELTIQHMETLAQLPQQLALGVGKDWNCDFFSHYISLVLILAGSRNPSRALR